MVAFIKKSPEIFWLQNDFIQKRPRKKILKIENACEQRMFTTMLKKAQLILKTPMAIYKELVHKEVFLMKTF